MRDTKRSRFGTMAVGPLGIAAEAPGMKIQTYTIRHLRTRLIGKES
jgi:hypothetical protein